MTSKQNEGVELEVQFHHATERAVLVSADGNREAAKWLPRSQIAIGEGQPIPGRGVIFLPQRLAEEKGLV